MNKQQIIERIKNLCFINGHFDFINSIPNEIKPKLKIIRSLNGVRISWQYNWMIELWEETQGGEVRCFCRNGNSHCPVVISDQKAAKDLIWEIVEYFLVTTYFALKS